MEPAVHVDGQFNLRGIGGTDAQPHELGEPGQQAAAGRIGARGALGGKIGIGEAITVVQDTFGKVFNEGTEFQRDGSQFDRLFKDGDSYQIGGMTVFAMHTPGHTPACMTHVVGDAAFVGDTLFMPDGGSARADFPGGDARTLYRSIKRVLSLPAETRLFMCHDYAPGGREIRWETTVGAERAANIHVRDGVGEAATVYSWSCFASPRISRISSASSRVLEVPAPSRARSNLRMSWPVWRSWAIKVSRLRSESITSVASACRA
jgi:glyoxylase-like metal-dependent hydrolase (beta-lactamase superfamily II)